MSKKLFGLLLAITLCGAQAFANEPVHTTQLGKATISHPDIMGFKEVQTLSPGVFNFFEQLTPAPNKLLAAYMLSDDYSKLENSEEPSMRRYILVQIMRQFEATDMTPAEFNEVKDVLRSSISVDKGMSDKMKQVVQEGVDSVKQQSEFAKELSIGQPTILAVDDSGENSFAYTSLMNVQNQVDGELETAQVLTQTTTIRASNRVFYIYLSEQFNGDVTWAQNFGRMIAGEYMRLNPND